jgi:hypothetical protein
MSLHNGINRGERGAEHAGKACGEPTRLCASMLFASFAGQVHLLAKDIRVLRSLCQLVPISADVEHRSATDAVGTLI